MKIKIIALISTLQKVAHNVGVDQTDLTQEIISISKLSSINDVKELQVASLALQNTLIDKKLIERVISELEYYAQCDTKSLRSLRRTMVKTIEGYINLSRTDRPHSYSDSIEIECRQTSLLINDLVLENLGTQNKEGK